MKIEVNMKAENLFEVSQWWAKTPEFVLEALQKQLAAARAIWPSELEHARVIEGTQTDTLLETLDKSK